MPVIITSSTLIARYRADTAVYQDAGITPAIDGSPVYQWNDLTGNGHHLTQTNPSSRPTLSSNTAWRSSTRSSIFFNNNFLNLPSSLAFSSAGFAILMCSRGTGSSLFSLGSLLTYGFNNGMLLTDSTPHPFPTETYLPTLTPIAHGIRCSPATARLCMGNNQTSDLPHSLTGFTANGGTLGQNFTGDIYELAIYSSPPSDTDLAQSVNNLQDYNAITPQSNTHQIIFIGDSNLTTAPAQVCQELGDTFKPLVLAQSTNTIAQQQTAVNAQLSNLDLTPFDQTLAIVCAGTTDNAAGRTDSQIATDLAALCTSLKSLSMRVILATIPSTSLSGVNSLLRANYPTFADTLVDWASDARLADPTNTITANNGIKAALLRPAVESFLSSSSPPLTFGHFYTGGSPFTGAFGHFVRS